SNLPNNQQSNQKKKVIDVLDNKFVKKQVCTEHVHETEVEINTHNSLLVNRQTNDVAVQVSKETHEFSVQVSDVMLHTLETHINLFELQLNSKINELEDLKKQLYYIYDYIIKKLKIYLSSILEELVAEKNEKVNAIDITIKNQKGVR
ncbi:779_t:CDS:2, partial [Racocetra fulgida]